MQQKYDKLIAVLFCLFLGGGLLWHVVLADKQFSETENRYLQQMPKITLQSVKDGTFMESFETYTTDQFPLRDLWVSSKAWCERLSGKRANNGVYFAENDTLIHRVDTPSVQTLEKNSQYLNALAEKTAVPVYLGLIPSAGEIWRDKLPLGAPTADEKTLISDFYNMVNVKTIDMYGALFAHKQEEIFYRTDHHWTTLGAYYGYAALSQQMGFPAAEQENYSPETVSTQFNGTLYSSSGVRWVTPDKIERYVQDNGITVWSNFTGELEQGQLYAPDYLEKKDKYSYFLGGVQPLCIISSQNAQEGKLLIIRDSYSDSLAPFLTENFAEIHLLDLRYYNMGVSQYIEENEITSVLVLYSFQNFFTDINLFKLGI